MTSELYVFAPLQESAGGPLRGDHELCGRIRWAGGTGEFSYAKGWLESNDSYPLDPLNLPLRPGPFTTQTNDGVHGVLADAGPDGWGRKLLELARGAPPSPLEALRLANGSGTGALLFSQSRSKPAPMRTLVASADLDGLETAAREIANGEQVSTQALELVFQAGSSLGGARPKVNMTVAGRRYIAKFQKQSDDIDIPRLEWACLKLAERAGLAVPDASIIELNGRSALLVERFDRVAERQIHYLSLHALALNTNRVRPEDVVAPAGRLTFGAIASVCRRIGVADAGAVLFRRMLFNIMIGNTDDHLRNHGLLFDGNWRHAPTFDVVATGGTLQAIGVGTAGRVSTIDNAMSDLGSFGLAAEEADQIFGELRSALDLAPGILDASGLRKGDRDLALVRMRRWMQ